MILDVIQGCRYLRRSTDRWTLSKNSTTRQRTQGFGVKPVCYENVSNTITYNQGSYLYPVVAWLLEDYAYNIWYLTYHPSANAYPSIRPFRSGHVITQSHEISANSPFAERKQLPTASFSVKSFWRNLPSPGQIFPPNWAHKSDSSLYQILVLTYAPLITG
jgi:hypothetical protein